MSATIEPIAKFTADFSKTKRFKFELEPSNPIIGETFKIRIYAPESYKLETLYGTASSNGTETISQKTEIVAINAVPAYPVQSVISKKAANPIVSSQSHTVVIQAGQPVADDVDTHDDYIGNIELVYKTFDAQVFSHSGINKAGECLIWGLDNNGCRQEIRFSVQKPTENTGNYQIAIELHNRTLSLNKVAIRVFPADSDITVRVSTGLLELISTQLIEKIENTSLNFQDVINTQWPLNSGFQVFLDSSVFLDENYNETSVNAWVSDGKIHLSKKVHGTLSYRYLTQARIFNYSPPNGNWRTFSGARMLAFNKAKKAFALFTISNENQVKEPAVVARVYREIVVEDQRYELPTTFSDPTISYASYPGADISKLTTDSAKVQQTKEEIYWDAFSVWSSPNMPDWAYPTVQGSTFLDVQWKISVDIPQDVSQADADVINAKINEIKAKYGIA